jgi:hypothetical protein
MSEVLPIESLGSGVPSRTKYCTLFCNRYVVLYSGNSIVNRMWDPDAAENESDTVYVIVFQFIALERNRT